MNYQELFKSDRITTVGIIGSGTFGRSFLASSRSIPNIEVRIICDQDITAARGAGLQAGLTTDELKICHTGSEANDTVSSGKTAVIDDGMLMMNLPIDVVVEATGSPDVGAIHARSAIEHGKHVVMATKETDCVVGPVLSRLARNKNLVYSPSDGDQPSLLIGLLSWAATLGFEIVCAGKAAELDLIFDPAANTVMRAGQIASLSGTDLWEMPNGATTTGIQLRRQILATSPLFSVADLCEMAIVINSTAYSHDAPRPHAPIVRMIEMPDIMCRKDDGGIFSQDGVIDMVNCLRRTDEVSFAGGVFVIVKCRERETWRLLKDKGHLVNRAGTRAMIFRPHHLLGAETAMSVLSANQLNLSTGSPVPLPRVDVGIRASRTLPKGEKLDLQPDHPIDGAAPELLPAKKMAPGNPIPYYLAAGNRLTQAAETGELLTYEMINGDPDSVLWKLRQAQDQMFTRSLI